jgi:hypothetical protein
MTTNHRTNPNGIIAVAQRDAAVRREARRKKAAERPLALYQRGMLTVAGLASELARVVEKVN